MRVRIAGIISALAVVLGTASCSANRIERTSAGDIAVGAQPTLATVLAGWPSTSSTAANQMIAKYGAPDEHTASMLMWRDRGPFRRTMVYREEVPHAFPKQHVDVIEQVIAYRIPAELTDELTAFSGSMKADRTRGELSARCDTEAMNILALNLADEILTRRATVTDARITFALQGEALAAGRSAPLTERLVFRISGEDTRDQDTPLSPPRR